MTDNLSNICALVLKIDQEFNMMFGDEVSGRFLAKWPTDFKAKVVTDCKIVLPNQYIEELLSATEPQPDDNWSVYIAQCTFYVMIICILKCFILPL